MNETINTQIRNARSFIIDMLLEGHSLEDIIELDIATMGEFAEMNATTIEAILDEIATMIKIRPILNEH